VGYDAGEEEGSSHQGELHTFLIADVRGYTRFSDENGDEAASDLAKRFAAIVHDAIPPLGGHVLELRGDEALCVFSSARAALSAAVELQRRFRERIDGEPALPLGVGIGLDAGEAVPTEGGYRGRALNVASRLCSLARPGEILASETVRNVAGRQERLTYAPRRPTRVKGVAEPVRLVEVVSETELPPVPAAAPLPKRRVRTRPLLLGIALAAALVAALVAVVLARGDDAQPVVVAPNSVAVIDPSKNEVADAIGVGDSPGPIAAGSGSVWVVNLNDRTLTKIDPAARSVVQSVGLHVGSGLATPSLLIAAAGDDVWVWACHQSLFRVDPRSGQVAEELEIFRNSGAYSGYSCALAAEPGAAWVPMDYRPPAEYRPEVLHVDAPTDTPAYISERFPVPAPEDAYRSAMTIGAGSIWVADHDGGAVRRMDPGTGAITATVRLGDSPSAMVFGHGSAWVTNDVEDTVTRIDPRTTSVVRAISVGTDPVALAVGPDAIWVANRGDGTVSRIDPETNAVTETISVGHRPLGVAFADGLVWVTVRS
jgi:YVTN family beta-propeller protein